MERPRLAPVKRIFKTDLGSQAMRLLQHRWMKRGLIAAAILLPIVIGLLYRKSADAVYRRFVLPREIVILTGAEGGLYQQIGKSLQATIEARLGIQVTLLQTEGSLENLERLQQGQAQFAFYQPGTLESLTEQSHPHQAGLTTILSLYSQPVHLIVHRDAAIATPADLIGKRVQLGTAQSGDAAMSTILLRHFGLTEADIQPVRVPYTDLLQQFESDQLDAAIVAMGIQAPLLEDLFASEKCHLLEIPFRDALISKQVSLRPYLIPRGLYRPQPPVEPTLDVETVSIGAQLLAGDDASVALVWEITQLIMSEEFLKQNQLGELFASGAEFAEHRPEFPIHPGARSYFHPDFDVQVFEGWEALYSLAASLLIATVFLYQQYRRKLERSKEHKLDRFIQQLLDIEVRQLDCDQDYSTNDCDALQKLLDEVTRLRQQAFNEFTAHELNEDRAVDSFLEMCHSLSNKINSKLSRQRLDMAVNRLLAAMVESRSGPADQDSAAPEQGPGP